MHTKAQFVLSGKVIDPLDRSPLAYVNIGIKNKSIGTTSRADGSFSITIPAANQRDSLTFSLIGYSDLSIPVENSSQKLIPLLPRPKLLEDVVVSVSAVQEKKFGVSRRSGWPHFLDGITQSSDMFEIAQLFSLPNKRSKLNTVNLYINEASPDTVIYRINIYSFNGLHPASRLVEKSILRREKLEAGWLSVDISSLGIYGSEQTVVSFEFLPGPGRAPLYEVKLGGRTKSFYRKNSQGQWQTAPHHYLMYLTAFISDEEKAPEEEKEAEPEMQLYSRQVKDSFSIFVHLPKAYSSSGGRRYPVLYLLDANAYFDQVVEILGKQNIEAMVIGIGYKNAGYMDSLRQRDYTFPNNMWCRICGGAPQFNAFIHEELMPLVDKKYRTRTDKNILAGHSLGGYYVLYDLLQAKKEKFPRYSGYLALSPSLDYGNYYLRNACNGAVLTDEALYLAYGEEEKNELGKPFSKDADSFLHSLRAQSSLKIISQQFSGLDHMETVLPGFEKGLQYLLLN